ncbi:DNA-damage-inducible protein F [Euzebya pacifica]|uniref:DNA-damage-inducible protein F n=1 Tax=Euzebya pacifica TaxID=1608957 RepID=A0A346XT65_9ACTN|nr:MATE family efflux transporter [Euzebya pacifica]AXV05412.1 DNA-damage-inducible protein F [Euzebya pacifica]
MDTAGRRREILGLALPATVALAADPLLGLVDTALVGRLGTDELAALGVATAVFTTAFVVFNVLTYGTTARVAQLVGARRPDDAATFTVQAIWASLAAGLLVTTVLVIATGPILDLMGASGGMTEPATTYLRIRAFAAVPVLLVQVGHGALRGLKDTRTPLVVTVAANVVNAILSVILIHPVGLGVAGAALGTVIAQSLAAVTFMVIVRRRLPAPSLRPVPSQLATLARISRDLFVRTVSLVVGLAVLTAAAARIDTVAVAGHQVARELWLLSTLMLDGFAIAGQAMVGTALGEGDRERARADAWSLTRWGLGAGVVAMLVYLPLGDVLPGVFTTDPAVIETVGSVWLLVAFLQPIGGVTFVLDGVFMGAGDFTFLMGSTVTAVVVGLLPVIALALSRGWGLPGLWWSVVALMVIRVAAQLWRLRGVAWTEVAEGQATP